MSSEIKGLKELQEANQYMRRTKEYPYPSSVITQLSGITSVKLDPAIEIADNGNVYQAYPKYIIESKRHADTLVKGFEYTVGILVNANSNEFTVYSGLTARACLNLNIFGASFLVTMPLIENVDTIKLHYENAMDNVESQARFIKERREQLASVIYTDNQFKDRKGHLLSMMNTKLIPYLVHAEKELRDTKGLYYDMPQSDLKLLDAMTDLVSTQGVMAKVEKTLELEALFNV